ncbi:MAG: class I SAM-dependent methyltransferase [Bacteroidetes bacterium]|nr:class I SAM-dependent methyltransferase [Bacteroidota bacterium]
MLAKIKSYWNTKLRTLRYAQMSRQDIFNSIYNNRTWTGMRNEIPVSGRGSMLANTQGVRKGLEEIVENYAINLMVDIGCGDFTWMQKTNLPGVYYTGTEIVSALVHQNEKLFGSSTLKFIELDICKHELPKADLILCRDCMVHLSLSEISMAIKNIQSSNATYLLATTFTGITENKEIVTGLWRPINLELPPFNFSTPEFYLKEDDQPVNSNGIEKALGFWKLK